MNKWLYFVGGLVLGVCLTVTILYFLSSSSPAPKANQDAETLISQAKEENEVEDNRDGVTIFEEAGDIINEKSIKVFQVIAEDAALANGDTELIGVTSLKGMYAGPVYAIVRKRRMHITMIKLLNCLRVRCLDK